MKVWPGQPYPPGATWDGAGVNFALFSENATAVDLCLFERPEGAGEVTTLHVLEVRVVADAHDEGPASGCDTLGRAECYERQCGQRPCDRQKASHRFSSMTTASPSSAASITSREPRPAALSRSRSTMAVSSSSDRSGE